MPTNTVKYSKEYYETHVKPWRVANKEKLNSSRRKYYHEVAKFKEFGITKEQYNTLLDEQKGVCAICGLPQLATIEKQLCIDHNHATGEIRGLLCEKCNWGIGLLNDDIRIMQNAIKYINKYTTIDLDAIQDDTVEEEEVKDE